MLYNEKKKKSRDTKNYNKEYDEEVQKVLISMLLSDPAGFAIARSIIKDEYFDDRLRPAVRFIMDYTEQERKLPPVELVKAKSGVTVEKFSEDANHTDYLLKEIEAFCQYKAMEIAVLDSVELLQTGRAGEIVERAKSALTISLMSDLGTDYFKDPEVRLRRMLDKSAYVSTGWKALDNKLYGGFTRGGLNTFIGISGSGKSLWLQNIAINWSMMGYTVLYISLELSEELVSLRLDAMITGRGTSEVLHDVDGTVMRIRKEQRENKPGKLFVKRLPEGGTTVNVLRAYVKEFQIKTGLKPDAIIIDYLDLMYPNNSYIDPSNLFVKDKFVSEEVRGFMHETNTFGATASQVNRCLKIDTSIIKDTGITTISSLKIGDKILGSNGFVSVTKVYKPAKQKAYKITTKSGKEIICSANHRFPTNNGLLSIDTGLSAGDLINKIRK